MAPEYAVKAPVEVMAEPVSYTKASSYKAATEGLPICQFSAPDAYSRMRRIHYGDAVVVNMGHFMELLLYLSVLTLWPVDVNGLAGALLVIDGIKGQV